MSNMSNNMSKTSRLQYAALPYRRVGKAAMEVMLITSRQTGRWIIPKGWLVDGLAEWESAAHEAREEGGLIGRMGDRPIGHYRYKKRLPDSSLVACLVEVFPLEVERQLKSWPEQKERRTRWFMLQAAARAVDEPELAAIIRELPKHLAPRVQPPKAVRRRVRAA
jgi:8-oxo-dGTP pyrophosphatase MutT (NUDIX family)